MTVAGARALALQGISELETLLLRQPPTGATREHVADFFARNRKRLARAISTLLRAAPRQPLCSICRRQRGTDPECDRCAAYRRMRDNPLTEAELTKIREERMAREAREQEKEDTRRARLRGHRVLVGLVGCGRTKAPTARTAKDLYLGSLFQAARAYAELLCDEWVILSALYGVLTPDQIVEPYDWTLSSMRLTEREAWAQRVSSHLNQRYRGLQVLYIGLAGSEYLRYLRLDAPIDQPLRGMGIGARVKYLRDAVKESKWASQ